MSTTPLAYVVLPRGSNRTRHPGDEKPSALKTQVPREVANLEAVLDRNEESSRVGSVDDAVIVGERQVDHRADGDRVRSVLGDHDGLFGNDSGSEDGRLGEEHDGRVEERTARSRVR